MVLLLSLVVFSASAYAQIGGRAGPPGIAPVGISAPQLIAPPSFLPATVARQSAIPFVPRPSAPILGNNAYPRFSTCGGFGYYPGYGSAPSNININYNYNYTYTFPEPYVPPRYFDVPPDAPIVHPDTARLTLAVPKGAEVFIGGKRVEIPGANRTFESPDLKPDETFVFEVRVSWKVNDKEVVEKRSLSIKPGERQSLQFIALPPTPVRIDK